MCNYKCLHNDVYMCVYIFTYTYIYICIYIYICDDPPLDAKRLKGLALQGPHRFCIDTLEAITPTLSPKSIMVISESRIIQPEHT